MRAFRALPPSVLIVPPALTALLIFLRRYYIKNPVRRVSDPNFLCAIVCVCAILPYVLLHGLRVGDPGLPIGSAIVGWTMLAAGIMLSLTRPPESEGAPDT